MSELPQGLTGRRDAGLYGYERALRRAGLDPVAGVDEAVIRPSVRCQGTADGAEF